MFSKSALLVFTSSILSSTLAWDPSTRDCSGHLCLTSFIWCNNRDGVSATDASCYYPPDVYPWEDLDSVGTPRVLDFTKSYNISWTNQNEDFPLTIRWSFPDGNSSSIAWEYNVTSKPTPSYFIFNPAEQLNSSYTNLTHSQIVGESANPGNMIQIYQFEWAEKDKAYKENLPAEDNAMTLGYTDYSDNFIMENSWAIQFAQNWVARNNESWEHKLKLGLGIGLGVGVPVMMAFAAALAWCCASKQQRYETVKDRM